MSTQDLENDPAAGGVDLAKIITPELLESMRTLLLPWPEDKPVDFAAAAKLYFLDEPDSRPKFYDLTFERVLKPLSTIGLDNVPDLMQFLPSVDALDFPSKAIGLTILLDQSSRTLFSGVNVRWTNGYFDVLSIKLARQLLALPHAQSPHNMDRLTAQGWSFDYAIAARIWLTAPFVHSPHIEDQELQTKLCEEIRTLIEKRVGKTDPYRATEEEDSKDIYAFSRLIFDVPAKKGTQIDEFMFWLLRIFRVHTPIIRRFGRYPAANKSAGRESTKEEVQYLEETNHFGELQDEEAAKRIREDVLAGRWTPLQDETRFTVEGLHAQGTHTYWDKIVAMQGRKGGE